MNCFTHSYQAGRFGEGFYLRRVRVADFRSEWPTLRRNQWPRSHRNAWPTCPGIRRLAFRYGWRRYAGNPGLVRVFVPKRQGETLWRDEAQGRLAWGLTSSVSGRAIEVWPGFRSNQAGS